MEVKTFKTREILKKSERCGCYYCGYTFNYSDINEWFDGGKTAACPQCSVDSVIGSNQVDNLDMALKKMNKEFFGSESV